MRMIPEDLTAVLAETLRVYKALADAGSPPTVRQLAEELGISRPGAYVRLKRLRELGYLTMPPVTQTRLRVTAKGKKVG